jgi:crossover junction endodeoxyribonuclease RuvC
MIALGVDPGTLCLGWGVVSRAGTRLQHLGHGVIRMNGKLSLSARLRCIEQGLAEVVERFAPEVGSVETLFFHKDAQAAAKLGHARGVVLLTLERAGVKLAEYAPARVKRTVAGGGRAEKKQVAMMVRTLLSLNDLPPPDAADALALAVTHLRVGGLEAVLRENNAPPQVIEALTRARRRRRAPRAMARSR